MNLLDRFFGQGTPQVEPTQVKTRLGRHPKPFLVDVRQPEEYREGHIQGARLIPLGDLSQRLKELPKNHEIICVCRSGSRSNSAAKQLITAGYRASNLKGGMIGWTRAGLPVQKGKVR
jgi:rhodanese-related sulfurtransferase